MTETAHFIRSEGENLALAYPTMRGWVAPGLPHQWAGNLIGGEKMDSSDYVMQVYPGMHPQVKRRDGKPMTLEDHRWVVDNIISSMKGAALMMRAQAQENIMQILMPCVEWVYPKTRRDQYSSGPCIYFIVNPEDDTTIKVGKTTKLTQRTRNFRNQLGVEPQVLAFAKTPDIDELEKCIHATLSSFRIRGEWFERDAVLELLYYHSDYEG